MYALREWSYKRPTKTLYDTVREIVERLYEKTQRPVPFEVVVSELVKHRKFINLSSIQTAICCNPALRQVLPGYFTPRRFFKSQNDKDEGDFFDRVLAKFEKQYQLK